MLLCNQAVDGDEECLQAKGAGDIVKFTIVSIGMHSGSRQLSCGVSFPHS